MRGIEVLLLTGFIGLIAIGVWNARDWLPEWIPRAVYSAPLETTKLPSAFSVKPNTGSTRVRSKHAAGIGRSFAGEMGPGEFPISQTEVDVPITTFPSEKDLAIGSSSVQIRAQYGEPTARVTEVRGGHVLEHYYYFNRDRTQMTKATLENGRVVAAESTLP